MKVEQLRNTTVNLPDREVKPGEVIENVQICPIGDFPNGDRQQHCTAETLQNVVRDWTERGSVAKAPQNRPYVNEAVAHLEDEAKRLADLSRSHGDKGEWAVIMRKQSILADMVEKFWRDAQRLIDS